MLKKVKFSIHLPCTNVAVNMTKVVITFYKVVHLHRPHKVG